MPRPSKLAAALAAALVLSSAALAGDLDEGLELKGAGKFAEALPKLEKAVQAHPGDAGAALALSEVLAGLGEYERAAKCLSEAIEAHPEDVKLLVQRGRSYMLLAAKHDAERSDPNMILAYAGDADRWVKQALEKDPANADALYLRARIHQYQGADAANVVAALEAVLKDHPKHFDSLWELGQIAMRQAQAATSRANPWGEKAKWAAAERRFRAACAADPKSGQALLQATYAKAWQQAPAAELIGDYARCAELLPGDEAPCLKVWSLRKQAAAESRAALEKLAKDPAQGTRPKAFLALTDGEAALAAGKPAEAVTAFCKAAEWYGPGDAKDAYLAIYRAVLSGQGLDVKQRDEIATAAWKAWPDRVSIPNDFALWLRDKGGNDKLSLAWYLRAAKIAPDSPRVLNDTGVIYQYHLNEFDEAAKWYRKAIEKAEEQGVEWSNKPTDEGMGLRDSLTNLAKILASQKKWKELRELASDHMPEDFPGREQWLAGAKDQK